MASRSRGLNYYTSFATLMARFPSDFVFGVGQSDAWAGGTCPTVEIDTLPNPILYKRADIVKIVNNESPPQVQQSGVVAHNTGGSLSDGTYTYRFTCYGAYGQLIESKSSAALIATISNSAGHGSVTFALTITVGLVTESVFPPDATKFMVYRSISGNPTLIAEIDIENGLAPTTWTDDGSDPDANSEQEAPLGIESIYSWSESVGGVRVQRYFSPVNEAEATDKSSRSLYLRGTLNVGDMEDEVTPFRAWAIYQGLTPKTGYENQDHWTPDQVESVGNIMYIEHLDLPQNVYEGNDVSLGKVFQIGG